MKLRNHQKSVLRIESLEARQMFAGDFFQAAGNTFGSVLNNVERLIDTVPIEETQPVIHAREELAVVDVGPILEPILEVDEPKAEEEPKTDAEPVNKGLELPDLPEIIRERIPDPVIELPIDLCDLQLCIADPIDTPVFETAEFSSFSLRDASGDNTDHRVFQNGALEYGYEFSGSAPISADLVLAQLGDDTEHAVALMSGSSVAGQYVALPELEAGNWVASIRATLESGEQVTSGAVDLEVLETRFARGSFQGETFLLSDHAGNGLVVLGRGGTDSLILDGVNYSDVVSFNEHTSAFDLIDFVNVGDVTVNLPIADRFGGGFGIEDQIDLVLPEDIDFERIPFDPTLEFPADPSSTDLQAIYQGMSFDFLQLVDGREIYFMGIEQLTFDDIGTVNVAVSTNDTLFAEQWNLHVTDVPGAWRFSTGSEDVLLVSLDSGVLPDDRGGSLTDLDANRLITDPGDDDDGEKYGHGHKAISVMASTPNNEEGIAGINWQSDVLVLDLYGLSDTFSRDAEDVMLAAEDLSVWAEGYGGDVADAVNDTLDDLHSTMQSLADAVNDWIHGEDDDTEGFEGFFDDLGNLLDSVVTGTIDIITGGIEGIQQLGNLIGEAIGLGAEIVEEMDVYMAEMSNSLFPLVLIQTLDQAADSGQRVVFQGGIQGESWLAMMEATPWMWTILEAHGENSFFAVAAGNGDVDIDEPFDIGTEDGGLSGGVARLSSQFDNFAAVGALKYNDVDVAGFTNAEDVFRAGYSNFGDSLTLMAPTDSLAADLLNDAIETFTGTSCANPNLAAMSSLVWSTNTDLTGAEIREILVGTAMDLETRGHDGETGHGLVDAESAIRRAVALARRPELAQLGDYSGMMQSVDALQLPIITGQLPGRTLGRSSVDAPVDEADQTTEEPIAERVVGDANGDGFFNSDDFVHVFIAGEYEDEIEDNSSWEEGDWNGDGDFDSNDIVLAFQQGGYEVQPAAAPAAAPEASTGDSPSAAAVDQVLASLDEFDGLDSLI